MARIHDLSTPSLLLDLDVLEDNLARMAARAYELGVRLRPHVKTHKCLEIGRMQMEAGAKGITVATVEEAKAFAEGGFDDILWAFPVVPSRLAEAVAIDRSMERPGLALLVDSAFGLDAIEATGHPFRVAVKVDCGYHRCGIDPRAEGGFERLRSLLERIGRAPGLDLFGLVSHSGHAYHRPGRAWRARVGEEERSVMAETAERIREADLEVPTVSVGSTPAMTAVESLAGVDEARPGNYALFDGTQVALGSCGPADCAATVLATVVSAGRGHAVVDAGALALSKDTGHGGEDGMGAAFALDTPLAGEPSARLVSLSQEHGKLDRPLPVGSLVRVRPNHSCLTVACFDRFVVVRGEEVVDRWRVHRDRF